MHDDAMMAREQNHATIIPAAAGSIFGLRLWWDPPGECRVPLGRAGGVLVVRAPGRPDGQRALASLPCSTVRAPGHLGVYLLVQTGRGLPSETLPDELRSCCSWGSRATASNPSRARRSCYFALAPLVSGPGVWRCTRRVKGIRSRHFQWARPAARGVTQAFTRTRPIRPAPRVTGPRRAQPRYWSGRCRLPSLRRPACHRRSRADGVGRAAGLRLPHHLERLGGSCSRVHGHRPGACARGARRRVVRVCAHARRCCADRAARAAASRTARP